MGGNQPPSADYTLGIYQAIGGPCISDYDHCWTTLIGFREFNDYLTSEEPSAAGFRDAVERMKVSTRQYAKRQISWIRNKLLPAIRIANSQTPNCVPMYLLDATSKFLCLLNFQHHHLCRTWRKLVFECQEPSDRNNGRCAIDITKLMVSLSTVQISWGNELRRIHWPCLH